MIRTALAVFALIAVLAATGSAVAQTAAPVRTLGAPSTERAAAIAVSDRKAGACTGRTCSGKPARREAYVPSAPLGW